MIKLICKNVIFYSQNDETSFFNWLKNINHIEDIIGVDNEIQLIVSGKNIPSDSLRDLIAVFYRYNVAMEQLAQFVDDKNKEWFQNPKMFWYEKVWGSIK